MSAFLVNITVGEEKRGKSLKKMLDKPFWMCYDKTAWLNDRMDMFYDKNVKIFPLDTYVLQCAAINAKDNL